MKSLGKRVGTYLWNENANLIISIASNVDNFVENLVEIHRSSAWMSEMNRSLFTGSAMAFSR